MNSLMHRVVIMAAFFVSMICFLWQIFFKDSDLLHSAFISLCVLFAASIVFMTAVKTIAGVLFKFLQEKKLQQIAQERKEAHDKAAKQQQ